MKLFNYPRVFCHISATLLCTVLLQAPSAFAGVKDQFESITLNQEEDYGIVHKAWREGQCFPSPGLCLIYVPAHAEIVLCVGCAGATFVPDILPPNPDGTDEIGYFEQQRKTPTKILLVVPENYGNNPLFAGFSVYAGIRGSSASVLTRNQLLRDSMVFGNAAADVDVTDIWDDANQLPEATIPLPSNSPKSDLQQVNQAGHVIRDLLAEVFSPADYMALVGTSLGGSLASASVDNRGNPYNGVIINEGDFGEIHTYFDIINNNFIDPLTGAVEGPMAADTLIADLANILRVFDPDFWEANASEDGLIPLFVLQSYDVASRPNKVQKAYSDAIPDYPSIPMIILHGTADDIAAPSAVVSWVQSVIKEGKQENLRLYFVKGASHIPSPLEISTIGFTAVFALQAWVQFGIPPGDLSVPPPVPLPLPPLPAGCEIPNSKDAGFEEYPEGYVAYILALPDCV